MSFEYPTLGYNLRIDAGPCAGLEIQLRSAGAEACLAVEQLPAVIDTRLTPVQECIEAFCRLLLAWNVTEGGQPVPCTREQFLMRSKTFVLSALGKWVYDVRADLVREARDHAAALVAQQAAPAPESTTVEDRFDESSIPMETLTSVRRPGPASGKAQRAPRKRTAPKRVTAQPDAAQAI